MSLDSLNCRKLVTGFHRNDPFISLHSQPPFPTALHLSPTLEGRSSQCSWSIYGKTCTGFEGWKSSGDRELKRPCHQGQAESSGLWGTLRFGRLWPVLRIAAAGKWVAGMVGQVKEATWRRSLNIQEAEGGESSQVQIWDQPGQQAISKKKKEDNGGGGEEEEEKEKGVWMFNARPKCFSAASEKPLGQSSLNVCEREYRYHTGYSTVYTCLPLLLLLPKANHWHREKHSHKTLKVEKSSHWNLIAAKGRLQWETNLPTLSFHTAFLSVSMASALPLRSAQEIFFFVFPW